MEVVREGGRTGLPNNELVLWRQWPSTIGEPPTMGHNVSMPYILTQANAGQSFLHSSFPHSVGVVGPSVVDEDTLGVRTLRQHVGSKRDRRSSKEGSKYFEYWRTRVPGSPSLSFAEVAATLVDEADEAALRV